MDLIINLLEVLVYYFMVVFKNYQADSKRTGFNSQWGIIIFIIKRIKTVIVIVIVIAIVIVIHTFILKLELRDDYGSSNSKPSESYLRSKEFFHQSVYLLLVCLK